MKKEYQFQGRKVLGEEIEFETDREKFNSYFLEDGTKLKFRTVVTAVIRLDDAYDTNGSPAYIVQSSHVVVTDSPPHLFRKPD